MTRNCCVRTPEMGRISDRLLLKNFLGGYAPRPPSLKAPSTLKTVSLIKFCLDLKPSGGLGSLCRIQTKWPFHKTLTRFWTANSVNVVINAIKHNTSDLELLARVASAKGKRKGGRGGWGGKREKTEGDWEEGREGSFQFFSPSPPPPPLTPFQFLFALSTQATNSGSF